MAAGRRPRCKSSPPLIQNKNPDLSVSYRCGGEETRSPTYAAIAARDSTWLAQVNRGLGYYDEEARSLARGAPSIKSSLPLIRNKNPDLSVGVFILCGEEDLNLHASRH